MLFSEIDEVVYSLNFVFEMCFCFYFLFHCPRKLFLLTEFEVVPAVTVSYK